MKWLLNILSSFFLVSSIHLKKENFYYFIQVSLPYPSSALKPNCSDERALESPLFSACLQNDGQICDVKPHQSEKASQCIGNHLCSAQLAIGNPLFFLVPYLGARQCRRYGICPTWPTPCFFFLSCACPSPKLLSLAIFFLTLQRVLLCVFWGVVSEMPEIHTVRFHQDAHVDTKAQLK